MPRRFPGLVTLGLLTACAGGTSPPPAAPDGPVLRLVRLEPRLGADVDTATVLSADVWYHVPPGEFEPERYSLTLVFQADRGGQFTTGRENTVSLDNSTGLVAFRYPLGRVLGDRRLAHPFTAYLYLQRWVDARPEQVDPDRAREGPRISVRGEARVIARSEPLFYGGTVPADTTWTTLRTLGKAIDEYLNRQPPQALALARDSSGRFATGYGYGYPTREGSIRRALVECEKARRARRVAAPCELFAVGARLVGPARTDAESLAESPPSEAAQVAAAFFDALADERWEDAARLVDPEAVEEFHRRQLEMLTHEPTERPSEADLVEQMLRHDPEMPHEVAAYMARRSIESVEERDDWLAFHFAGVDSRAQALALSPLDLMARHLEAQDPRYQFARSIERARRRVRARLDPERLEEMRPAVEYVIIGAVGQGDSLTHVVFSDRQPHASPVRPAINKVLPLRRTAAGWRVANTELWFLGGTDFGWYVEEQPADTVPPPSGRR